MKRFRWKTMMNHCGFIIKKYEIHFLIVNSPTMFNLNINISYKWLLLLIRVCFMLQVSICATTNRILCNTRLRLGQIVKIVVLLQNLLLNSHRCWWSLSLVEWIQYKYYTGEYFTILVNTTGGNLNFVGRLTKKLLNPYLICI